MNILTNNEITREEWVRILNSFKDQKILFRGMGESGPFRCGILTDAGGQTVTIGGETFPIWEIIIIPESAKKRPA